MTATDELRRLLDERGVEWNNVFASAPRNDFTTFEPELGTTVDVWQGGSLLGIEVKTSYSFTPEQAVDATLGRGTCSIEKRHMDWRCTGCGEIVGTDDPTSELFIDGNAVELWHYCPNCGRRRVG